MDSSGRSKYPVLFRPYGGPSSQTVQNRYRVDYTHYLASSMGFVVVEVDGRGTGYKGRKFRSAIRKNLGEVEAADQVGVAEHYASLPFVDERRIGIQGWSYGGYLAAKVIETNSTAFSLGISVAPVTDWRYYDTIYTERYMGTLDENRAGYQKSAVTSMEGFKHANFMLLHGSGDDNGELAMTRKNEREWSRGTRPGVCKTMLMLWIVLCPHMSEQCTSSTVLPSSTA